LEVPRLNEAERLMVEQRIFDPERPRRLLPKLKRLLD
jgi:hypothetical protein